MGEWYKCKICGEGFDNILDIWQHLAVKHATEKWFKTRNQKYFNKAKELTKPKENGF